MLGRIDPKTQRLDNFFCDLLRHLLAKQRNYGRFISGQDDLFDTFITHDLLEIFHYFLRVLQVIILFVSLISRLGPPTYFCMLGLYVFHFLLIDRAARSKHEDLGTVRVGKHDCVSPVLIDQTGEWIKMRSIGNKHPIALERRVELSNFKPIILRGAREDSESLDRSRDFTFEIANNPHEVLFKTQPFLRLVLISFTSLR